MRRELEMLRMENTQLRNGMNGGTQAQPSPNHQAQSQAVADPYASDPYGRNSRPELPPLRALSGNVSAQPDSMTGVQYDAQRTNGYRPERY